MIHYNSRYIIDIHYDIDFNDIIFKHERIDLLMIN